MTPRYASPEQIRGVQVTTVTDVYSLGVILYELLTGHRPYRLDDRVEYDRGRVVCEEEPATPSLIVTRKTDTVATPGTSGVITPQLVSELRRENPGQLRRRLRGDLDREALGRALDGIVARHEALRTTFAQQDGEPSQRIAPVEASGFRLLDHDLADHAEAESELRRLMVEERSAAFDLERGVDEREAGDPEAARQEGQEVESGLDPSDVEPRGALRVRAGPRDVRGLQPRCDVFALEDQAALQADSRLLDGHRRTQCVAELLLGHAPQLLGSQL